MESNMGHSWEDCMSIARRGVLSGLLTACMLMIGAGAASAQDLNKLVVLTGTKPPDPITHLLYYAREKGFYKGEGIDVEIRELAGEPLALRSLLAGDGDIVLSGTPQALAALNAGAKLKVISAFFAKPDYVVVGHKSIPDLKGLEGHTVGVSQIGAVSQLIPLVMINAAGGDTTKVKWVPAGNSISRLQALAANKLDAVPLNSSFLARALAYEQVHLLADATETLPQFLYGVELVTTSTLEKTGPALKAWIRALTKASQWFYGHVDEAVTISQSLLPELPPAEIEAGIKAFVTKRFFGADGIVPREKWDFTADALTKAGTISQTPSFDTFVVPIQ
jgi:NitT/TauT family transport system substrate-binding protein